MAEARGKLGEDDSTASAGKTAKPGSGSKTLIVGASKRTNQSALLAGVVKKKPRTSSGESDNDGVAGEKNGAVLSSTRTPSNSDCKDREGKGVAKVIGVLPGIGEYTDSSESDSEREEETIDTKHLGFMKQKKKKKESE